MNNNNYVEKILLPQVMDHELKIKNTHSIPTAVQSLPFSVVDVCNVISFLLSELLNPKVQIITGLSHIVVLV